MVLREFNRLSEAAAKELLHGCLPLGRWVDAVARAGPFRQLDDLFEAARKAAFPLSPAELEAALAARHPPVVVPATRPEETALELRLRQQLAAGVEHYQQRFGRPFHIRT